jgi:hypothetical protein
MDRNHQGVISLREMQESLEIAQVKAVTPSAVFYSLAQGIEDCFVCGVQGNADVIA